MRSGTGSAANRAVRITAALFCLVASGAWAEPTNVGTTTDKLGNRWVLTTSGTLDRGTLPIRRGLSYYLQIDGRSYSFNSSSSRTSSTSKNSKTPEQKPAEPPPGLKDDARFIFRFPDEVGFEWIRYVRPDGERGGMRFLDVLKNTSQQPRAIRVRCDNEMDVPNSDYFQGATTDRGEIISGENSNLPEETAGVMLHFSPDFSPALPFFLFGRPREPWISERRQEGYQLRLEYSGTLDPGKRAIFVHWVAGRGTKEKGKPEKAFEKFISAGHLVDPGVPKDWVPDVINFSKDAFESASPTAPASGVKLVKLDQLCRRLGTVRDDKDHLVLDRDSKIEGELKAAKLTLNRNGFPIPIPVENIAAISGGAGKGREHRVFLRDGSVLAGRVSLEGARFISKGVGEVALNVDSLDQLVLRTSLFGDGKLDDVVAGVAKTNRGEVLYLSSLPAKPLPGRTSVGVIEIPWSDITSIRERSNPDPCFVLSLKDGSRVICLPGFQDTAFRLSNGEDWQAATEMNGYTASAADLEALLAPEKEEDKPAGGWCEMTRGTVWAGHAAEGELQIEAAAGVTRFKSSELKSVGRAIIAPVAGAGVVFDIELTTGLKLRGRFVSPVLRWQRGDQVLELPWSQILELGTEAKK